MSQLTSDKLLQQELPYEVKPSCLAGVNMMLLNGLPVDGAALELYPLLDKIAAEVW